MTTITFDTILSELADFLQAQRPAVEPYLPLLVNRDLNGRVRIILGEKHEKDQRGEDAPLRRLAASIHQRLTPHTTSTPERIWLFEDDFDAVMESSQPFRLRDCEGNIISDVFVADRLASEATWSSIKTQASRGGIPRVVFYAMKGGVGRSTAVAACASALAQAGRRVLVLDLDLESPGLSASLLPRDRQPAFGITDWLVEDLVDNGDAVSGALSAPCPLSHDSSGEIRVVPAHGREPGEYLSKLGRIWMPKFVDGGCRQVWSERLGRLIRELEQEHQPDMLLMDSRAGIDEVASACVTDLGASRIYLFALDSQQTWAGYRILFQHWRHHGGALPIRDSLQIVGALIPIWGDGASREASNILREQAYDLFLETLYDETPAAPSEEPDNASRGGFDSIFSFDLKDQDAPHHPCCIPWNQNFAAIQSHYDRLDGMDSRLVDLVYGGLVADLDSLLRAAP
ncbi:MAG: AAA family ATPase [Cyanobacteria bacterium MAG CAR4_bin_6]|nr:AAA family ATPase [Cyanobacteria bacterium MAG CAR4_bin_6]